jgi:hypothetical protein
VTAALPPEDDLPALRARRDRLHEALARAERDRLGFERYLASLAARWSGPRLAKLVLWLLLPAAVGAGLSWLLAKGFVDRVVP